MPYGPADAVDPGTLKRALVIKLRHHGDVLLASPMFSVLKNRAPQLEIDALVYADTRDMLSLHPAIAQVHVVERDWKTAGPLARFVAEFRLLRQLRARRYDLLIHLSEHPRGAWLARALGPRVAVAPDHPNKPRLWKRGGGSASSRGTMSARWCSCPGPRPSAASRRRSPGTGSPSRATCSSTRDRAGSSSAGPQTRPRLCSMSWIAAANAW